MIISANTYGRGIATRHLHRAIVAGVVSLDQNGYGNLPNVFLYGGELI